MTRRLTAFLVLLASSPSWACGGPTMEFPASLVAVVVGGVFGFLAGPPALAAFLYMRGRIMGRGSYWAIVCLAIVAGFAANCLLWAVLASQAQTPAGTLALVFFATPVIAVVASLWVCSRLAPRQIKPDTHGLGFSAASDTLFAQESAGIDESWTR